MRLAYKHLHGFNCCLCDYHSDLDLEKGHTDILRHLKERHQRILVSFSDQRGGRRSYEGPYAGWIDQLPEEIRK